MYDEWEKNLGGTEEVPLSVISKHRICLAERDELLSRLWVFVHIRMELLAQLKEGDRLNYRIMYAPKREAGRTYLVEGGLKGAHS
jgi:hypothetical protein